MVKKIAQKAISKGRSKQQNSKIAKNGNSTKTNVKLAAKVQKQTFKDATTKNVTARLKQKKTAKSNNKKKHINTIQSDSKK